MVSRTWQTASMIRMMNVGSISGRACGHAMSSHCLRCMVSLGVCWRAPSTRHIWKLENDLLRLWRIYMDIEVVLWSAYVSFTCMLEMLHVRSMLICTSRQWCLMNVRWIPPTLSIIRMNLRHIVLHIASSALLRMTWNMMMNMWVHNVTSNGLLPISDLVVYLYAILLIMMRIIVTLLIFIWNYLGLTIIFTLSILAWLQSTEKRPGMIARSVTLVLINWSLNLRSAIGLLLLAFHDNILKKLNSFLHTISLIQPIGFGWLTSLSEVCIRLLILRGIKIHHLIVHVLLVIWCINLILVLIESFLVCASLAK